MVPAARFFPMGDRAIVVEFGDRMDVALSAHIAALAQRLRDSRPIGVRDIVPAYTTLTLHYDPAAVGAGSSPYEALAETIGSWIERQPAGASIEGRTVEIPVCYGGAFGEDLEPLARTRGLSVDEAIAIHSETTYYVHLLGFVPGFAYLGGLDARLSMPRRQTPRPRVPAGSVAIANEQTAVYPLETPGGWQVIGRTPLQLFRPDAMPPSVLNAGDAVRFVPISAQRFASLSGGRA
ncbi:MAG TPA: 5-oxoprolinase subunit PxpB [Burkholderiales bacterium]|nr:5-oxoprolinase subunit PxpB [Burkholderiales bacterium]